MFQCWGRLSVIAYFPVVKQTDYAGENTADYGTEVSSISNNHAAHTRDGENKGHQGPLEPEPFAKDHVASPSKDTVG
jgi:hypothetical protein